MLLYGKNPEYTYLTASEHFSDLLALGQQGQVHQERRPHAGAGIGGAGGEISKLRIKCYLQLRAELFVRFASRIKGVLRIKAGENALNSQMILLTNHHGNTTLLLHEQGSRCLLGGKLGTDVVLFHVRGCAKRGNVRKINFFKA